MKENNYIIVESFINRININTDISHVPMKYMFCI